MKLRDLFEMPDYIDKQMPVLTNSTVNFISRDTIDRDFDVISKQNDDDLIHWVLLKKDKSFAILGELSLRKADNKEGVKIIGQIDFKDKPDFAFDRLIDIHKHVLQVDSVQVHSSDKYKGFGYQLYLAIVMYGYVIVSDHTQYHDGKKIWQKISRMSNSNDYSVYVVNNGNAILDDKGTPKKFDGKNIDNSEIWGPQTNDTAKSKRYVLLVMKKNKGS